MFKFNPSKEWLENSLKLEADYDTVAGGMKMSENAEKTEVQKEIPKFGVPKMGDEKAGPVQKFKQIETQSFKSYDEADAYRKGLAVAENEKVRVKLRAHRNEYDVVKFGPVK
jgi:hypothetical protein